MKTRQGKIESGAFVMVLLGTAILTMIIAGVFFDVSPDTTTLSPEYTYDIEQYTEIDPALILYHQVGETIKADFQETRAIAVGPDNKIYVAGDKKIAIYTPDVSVPVEIELAAEPTCLTVLPDDTMVIGADNLIFFIDSFGVETARFEVPDDIIILTSMVVDSENVFVADAVNKIIWRFDRQGQLLGKIGEKDPLRDIPGFIIPSPHFDIAMASDGLLRVVNPGRHLIEAYTVDGDREWVWGKTSVSVEGFSGCCNPVNFAILPDGGFVTAEKGLVRVKTYDADGNFVGVVTGPQALNWTDPMRVCETPADCTSKALDVAADSEGCIYVLDTAHNLIRIFEKNDNE